ncbi:MAG: helical backbone metal receptor [Balneolaceae bacterium]
MSYQRIISLVPSLTELLIDLGLKDRLIGRTRFCIHPSNQVGTIPIIGGTKNPNIEKILALEPDLVISNKEENRKEDVEELLKHVEVIVTEIDSIQQGLNSIDELGKKLNIEEDAKILINSITKLIPDPSNYEPVEAAYFIWREPWMSIGNDTYINDVMKHFGLNNIFENQARYPVTTLKELSIKQPKVILLSSEPFPFKEKHAMEVRVACPESKVVLVDGEWFSWYGSRMLPAFRELNTWRKGLLQN